MIYSAEGPQRHGKNIFMTAFALYCAELVKPCPIYANYHFFNLPIDQEFHKFEKFSEIMEVTNSIIVFDEIGTTADARTWSGKEQTLFTHKFAQMGKDGNTFISSAQKPYLVEKRVREQADVVIECYKNIRTNTLYETWWDTQMGRELAIGLGTYIVNDPERAWNHYDTFERITSHVRFDDLVNK